MRIRSLALVLTLSLAGCPQSSQSDPELGQEFTLRAGQEVLLKGEGLKVRFDSVVEDGRCPPEVQCVWQGNAKIRLRLVKAPEGEGLIELNTAEGHDPKKFPAVGTYLDYKVRLVSLGSRPVEAHLLIVTNGGKTEKERVTPGVQQ